MNTPKETSKLTRRQLLKAAALGLIATVFPVRLLAKAKATPSRLCRCGKPHDQHLKFDMDAWAEAAAIEMRNTIDADILRQLK